MSQSRKSMDASKKSTDLSRKSEDANAAHGRDNKTAMKSHDTSRKNTDGNTDGHGSDNKPSKKNVEINGNLESGDAHNDKKSDTASNQHVTADKEASQEPVSLQQQLSNIEKAGRKDVTGEPIVQKKSAHEEEDQQQQQQGHDSDDIDEDDLSDDPDAGPAEEVAHDVGVGLGKTAEAIALLPMDLSLAIAQGMSSWVSDDECTDFLSGFHNAPRLYGDTTVRRPTRITGIKSGFKAAGEEFVYGVYDGFSGVVVQPYKGARDGGAVGFVKGVGMGLTGFVLKDLSAIFSPFAYSMKGVHKELLKNKQPTHFIRKARIVEGERDLTGLSEKEKREAIEIVDHGWAVVQQVWAAMEAKRSQGIRGRIGVIREHKTWRTNGAFENVEQAEKALDASKRGENLDGVFDEQRKELSEAKKPRRKVSKDMMEEKKTRETNGQAAMTDGEARRGSV